MIKIFIELYTFTTVLVTDLILRSLNVRKGYSAGCISLVSSCPFRFELWIMDKKLFVTLEVLDAFTGSGRI